MPFAREVCSSHLSLVLYEGGAVTGLIPQVLDLGVLLLADWEA